MAVEYSLVQLADRGTTSAPLIFQRNATPWRPWACKLPPSP